MAESPDALPYLEVRTGPGKGARMEIPLGKPLILGRDPGCHLTLDDPDISRHHARVYCDLEGSWVNDMESKNGVWVEERKISKPCILASGQILTLGGTQLEYVDPAELYLESLEQMADQILDGAHSPHPAGLPADASDEAGDQSGDADPDTDIVPGPPAITDTGDDRDSPGARPPESRAGFWIIVAVGAVAAVAALAALAAVLMKT